MDPKQNDPRTPEGALAVLDIATQPGVRLARQDFVNCQIALETLAKVAEAAAIAACESGKP